MTRQGAAFLTLLALSLAVAYFLQIAIVAKDRFEFGVADIVSCESGPLFALPHLFWPVSRAGPRAA
jgi:hypothetical protein